MSQVKHVSGVAVHIVCTDPEAHKELLQLCQKWRRKKRNSLFVDYEQSLESYEVYVAKGSNRYA